MITHYEPYRAIKEKGNVRIYHRELKDNSQQNSERL